MDYAVWRRADVIVMPVPSRPAILPVRVGGVLAKVLRTSPVPVLRTPPGSVEGGREDERPGMALAAAA